jgi:hypothetical protein
MFRPLQAILRDIIYGELEIADSLGEKPRYGSAIPLQP